MKPKHTYLVLIAIAIVTIACFTTCKKYDENYLWFKNPEKLTPFNGYITSYKINGVDSLEALDKYLDRNYVLTDGLKDLEFIEGYDKRENIATIVNYNKNGTGIHIPLEYEFNNKQKTIIITCGLGKNSSYPPNNIPIISNNIFVEKGLTWDIVKLTKTKKGQFKIKTIRNTNTYEITFN